MEMNRGIVCKPEATAHAQPQNYCPPSLLSAALVGSMTSRRGLLCLA